MGNYEQLKQAITNVVKPNGKREITGAIMQSALLSIISKVGNNATFAGIATPYTNPGTPDQNVFYLAAKPGIYANFGGVELIDQVLIFTNKNGHWVKTDSGIATAAKFTELASNSVGINFYQAMLNDNGEIIFGPKNRICSSIILNVGRVSILQGYAIRALIYNNDGSVDKSYFGGWYSSLNFNKICNIQISIKKSDESNLSIEEAKEAIKLEAYSLQESFENSYDSIGYNYMYGTLRADGTCIDVSRTRVHSSIIPGVKKVTANEGYQIAVLLCNYDGTVDSKYWNWKTSIELPYCTNLKISIKKSDDTNLTIKEAKAAIKIEAYTQDEYLGFKYYRASLKDDGTMTLNVLNRVCTSILSGIISVKINEPFLIRALIYENDGSCYLHSSSWSNEINLDSYKNIKISIKKSDESNFSIEEVKGSLQINNRIAADDTIENGEYSFAYRYIQGHLRKDGTFLFYDTIHVHTPIIPGVKKVTANEGYQIAVLLCKHDGTVDSKYWYWQSSVQLPSPSNVKINIRKSDESDITIEEAKAAIKIEAYTSVNNFNYINGYIGGIYIRNNPFGDEPNLLYKDAVMRMIDKSSKYYPLIIIAGQSNADGRADYTTAPSWLSENSYKVNNYRLWNKDKNTFEDYSVLDNNGAGDSSGKNKFSFDPFFAKEFISYYGRPLYAIRQTLGGIGIESQPTTGRNYTWQPKIKTIKAGCNSMCLELLDKIIAAYSYAKINNINLIPVAILWHQGENDADTDNVGKYKQNLSNLISWIRGIFSAPALPFLNAFIQKDYKSSYAQINSIFVEMNEEDYYMKTVDMEGHYTSIGDRLHFDASALEYMGKEMFNNYKIYNL